MMEEVLGKLSTLEVDMKGVQVKASISFYMCIISVTKSNLFLTGSPKGHQVKNIDCECTLKHVPEYQFFDQLNVS